MSETVVRFFLDELAVVRVICNCGVVSEMPTDKLDSQQSDWRCPGCGTLIRSKERNSDDLDLLARVFRAITGKERPYKVQFVIKETDWEGKSKG
jgi:hypothetical protein